MTDAETEIVRFEVCQVERVERGRLIGLAVVSLDIAGVELTLSGVQIMRGTNGTLECRAPVWRHPRSGEWLPGVLLPPELASALAAEVLENWSRT